jgi:uncharacterized repeat protein (TIGR03803 family)
VLVSFTGANGAHGNITPVLVGDIVYGATQSGGAGGDGVLFSVHTDGTGFTLLHQFAGADGSFPRALAAGPGGMVFGIAEIGGSNGEGVLFSINATGAYAVLHEFALPTSGYPLSLVVAANGTLVGSSYYGGGASTECQFGCGTVFSYVPATGAYSTLDQLPGSNADGQAPYVSGLGAGPTVYGAETRSVFSLSQARGFVPLAAFDPATVGNGVTSGPVYAPRTGSLYGVLGESSGSGGALYSIAGGTLNDLMTFASTDANGAYPISTPVLTPAGGVIGTNSASGICANCGTIWQYTP